MYMYMYIYIHSHTQSYIHDTSVNALGVFMCLYGSCYTKPCICSWLLIRVQSSEIKIWWGVYRSGNAESRVSVTSVFGAITDKLRLELHDSRLARSYVQSC